ncbi:MAG TPA: CoA-binding protein [Desulfobacteria bacterium]|nr:CoA-binding protein [Desulfobacteria bacterium]
MDFEKVKTIAVVGLSDKKEKASFRVAEYLQQNGFRIIPVNPTVGSILGEDCYGELKDISDTIMVDVVDIFRKSEAVPAIVQQAVDRGNIKTIWMQEGIINQEAADAAEKAGMEVIMDKCILKEHQNLKCK